MDKSHNKRNVVTAVAIIMTFAIAVGGWMLTSQLMAAELNRFLSGEAVFLTDIQAGNSFLSEYEVMSIGVETIEKFFGVNLDDATIDMSYGTHIDMPGYWTGNVTLNQDHGVVASFQVHAETGVLNMATSHIDVRGRTFADLGISQSDCVRHLSLEEHQAAASRIPSPTTEDNYEFVRYAMDFARNTNIFNGKVAQASIDNYRVDTHMFFEGTLYFTDEIDSWERIRATGGMIYVFLRSTYVELLSEEGESITLIYVTLPSGEKVLRSVRSGVLPQISHLYGA